MKDYATILEWSDDDIWEEIQDILYLYGLKDVIRYGIKREEELVTQSVAEHSALMFVLAQYFLELEQGAKNLDKSKVYEMVIYHDASEIEYGDTVSFKRTQKINAEEKDAFPMVSKNAPELLGEKILSYMNEYEECITPEARFVKALDKLEPNFYLIRKGGKRMVINGLKMTKEQFISVRESQHKYIEQYPIMKKFHHYLTTYILDNKYYIGDE